jgi:methylmalonyl-CoA epimerase
MADCIEGLLLNTTSGTPSIDHLGWAVRSIDSSRSHFESSLGLDLQSDERFSDVRVAFFGTGPARIELLEPLTPESDVGRFIARKGEGLHHLALRVSDVAAALAQAPAHGFRLIDRVPRPGARGTTVGVVDPLREDGVLVQYVQGP